MNLHPKRFSRFWLIFSLLVIFILAACGSFDAEEAYQTVVINPDLSGQAEFLLVMNSYQFSNVQVYYNDYVNTGSLLAYDVAQALEWPDYTWSEDVVDGEYVLYLVTDFYSKADFEANIMVDVDVPDSQIADNVPSSIPPGLERQDGLFNTIYTLFYISNPPDNQQFPIHVVATLPGTVVDTDGTIGTENKSQVFWFDTYQVENNYVASAMMSDYDVAFGADLAAATNNQLTVSVSAPAEQLAQLARIHRTGDTAQILGEQWAGSLGLDNFEVASRNESGRQIITLSTAFTNRQALLDQMNQIPLFSDMALASDDMLFNSGLTLQGTLVPSEEAFGQPDSIKLTVQMPGEIVDENGEKTGVNEQEWVWSAAANKPIHVSSALLTDYAVDIHADIATHDLAFTLTTDPAQLAQFAAANSTQTPAQALAAVLTANLNLTDFEVSEGEQSDQQWVKISTNFTSTTALSAYLNNLPLFSNISISETQDGLQTQYILTGTFEPNAGENAIPIAFHVAMPGELVENNGSATANQIVWQQNTTALPLNATSQDAIWRQPLFLGGTGLALACLCGVVLLGVGGVAVGIRRKRAGTALKQKMA